MKVTFATIKKGADTISQACLTVHGRWSQGDTDFVDGLAQIHADCITLAREVATLIEETHPGESPMTVVEQKSVEKKQRVERSGPQLLDALVGLLELVDFNFSDKEPEPIQQEAEYRKAVAAVANARGEMTAGFKKSELVSALEYIAEFDDAAIAANPTAIRKRAEAALAVAKGGA